jgi:hypothetical protein
MFIKIVSHDYINSGSPSIFIKVILKFSGNFHSLQVKPNILGFVIMVM